MSASPLDFYRDLEPVNDFARILDPGNYRSVPDSWFVAVTDVVRSTAAIDAGRYKEVNVAGSLAVMAFGNLLGGLDFPFAFGGDGMTLVLPGEYEATVRSLLADVRTRVREAFDLELRAGIVPVSTLRSRGSDLLLARLHVSDAYAQALFAGDGLDRAERLVKDPRASAGFLVPGDHEVTVRANLDGFSCRWEDIPSRHGETVSLIVRPTTADAESERQILEQVIDAIARSLGSSTDYHPLTTDAMRINTRRGGRAVEASAVTGRRGGLRFAFRLFAIRLEMFLTRLAIRWRIPYRRGRKRIDLVRESNVLSSDYRKFDGTLKMVVAVTAKQRLLLERLLHGMHARDEICYGMHVSDRAIMTCYIHFGSGNEVHFVDAADGGYALAARSMKEQMRA